MQGFPGRKTGSGICRGTCSFARDWSRGRGGTGRGVKAFFSRTGRRIYPPGRELTDE
ncbi:hypothetical protein AMC99_00274 [Altererythrobacter epoxidivorans]|uniref:Uncharacterized protein n=1 Tax=Altererythrobacter epoxidivorans TaxID=361183 RepID=A0A0M4M2I3_9SPHN|nr:hypothetical protein AMC99_00274 [Altererythrobacter epoxidivorans]